MIGTGIGGLLAQPAVNYPNVFSSSGFLAKYESRVRFLLYIHWSSLYKESPRDLRGPV